jgi:FtsP/CotA-like multicopper oxidase with cupredoxin domain
MLQICIRLILGLTMISLVSCQGSSAVPIRGVQGTALRELPVAVDYNMDMRVVEVKLSAAPMMVEFTPGVKTEVWAYNNSLPGPIIEAMQGDRVIVHFTNHLPVATSIHWHGVRLSNENDGTHMSQEPIPPGGGFTYDFIVPDASLFWYHPHFDSANQVYLGLYGPLLVHGMEMDEMFHMAEERVIVLSDINLENGRVMPPDSMMPGQMSNAMGFLGNTQLVNGQVMPMLELKSGGMERWRIVNASGGRFFNLHVPDHRLTMIGTDGGMLESAVDFHEIGLSSGERVDLILTAHGGTGKPSTLMNGQNHMVHTDGFEQEPERELMMLEYSGKPGNNDDMEIPHHLGMVDKPEVNAGEYEFRLFEDLDPSMADIISGAVPEDAPIRRARFGINGQIFPDVTPHVARLGTVESWTVINETDMDHPFHVHGYRFIVDSINGVPLPYTGWKDTVNIPGSTHGSVSMKMRIAFEDHPGHWPFHCHILKHAELGMMGELEVMP